MQTRNALNWFEIPVADMDRAGRFYSQVLHTPLKREPLGPHELMVFPYEQPGVGGCLIAGAPLQPSAMGSVLYLAINDSIPAALSRTVAAGGQVALGRTELPEGMGCYAHIIDTEGNRVGLHAAN